MTTVKELIANLQEFPEDLPVYLYWSDPLPEDGLVVCAGNAQLSDWNGDESRRVDKHEAKCVLLK